MCGRTSLFVPRPELEARFDAELVADGGYEPRYNIAPGDGLEVITASSSDAIDRFTWGLLPHWADDPGDGFINARAETAHEKPAFRDSWADRPCLVLSSGFYEWRDLGAGPKEPYRIHREGDEPFAMAGLWSTWEDDGDSLRTVTILTTEPNDVVSSIHDRMPVVLEPDAEETWLDAAADERRDLCGPYGGDDLESYPISTTVNDPGNDDPSVIEPADDEQSDLGSFA